jgi:pyroglutamyl-peptidase
MEVNPSQLVIESIQREDVITRLLPTEYDAAGAEIVRLIDALNPDALICLGVAQKRETICLERIALNLNDAPIPDNAGIIRQGQPIVEGAPLAYAATLPLEALRDSLAAHEIPVTISNHAGAFVCNHVFYSARHALETSERQIPCGFIHVPALEDVNGVGMSLETMVKAVDRCLTTLHESAVYGD